MYKKIKDIKVKGRTFEIDLCKSNTGEELFHQNEDSIISNKAVLRIIENNYTPIFYNPYGEGKHAYDFDSKEDLKSFILNNQYKTSKECNDYFIMIYADIEIDEQTNDIAGTSDNSRIIDNIIRIVMKNAII